MKTIGYIDKSDYSKTIKGYFVEGETRHERIRNALKDLAYMGNILIVLIKGNKTRVIANKRY